MMGFLTEVVLLEGMTKYERRKLAPKNKPFFVIAGSLYRKGIYQVIRRCVLDFEQKYVLREAH